MDREFLEGLGTVPQEAVDAILAEHCRQSEDWQGKYDALLREKTLSEVIWQAGGKNSRAIGALVDPEAAGQEALTQAVADIKKECPYLFADPGLPLFSAGTGAVQPAPQMPQTLAGALRERFARKNG